MAKLDTEFVPASTLDYLSKITDDSTSSVVTSLLNKFKKEIDAGIKEGKSSKQIASTLQSNFTDIKSKASANAVARTALHGAYNHGVLADTMDDPAIIAYRFVSIVDSRTTDICEALANKIIPKDEVLNYLPPLHFNCRSTLQPVYIIEKIDNEDLITNFRKTQKYKDKVEPSYNKKFNAYHNEDLQKTKAEQKPEGYIETYKKTTEKLGSIFIEGYDKVLDLAIDHIKDEVTKWKDPRYAFGQLVNQGLFFAFPQMAPILKTGLFLAKANDKVMKFLYTASEGKLPPDEKKYFDYVDFLLQLSRSFGIRAGTSLDRGKIGIIATRIAPAADTRKKLVYIVKDAYGDLAAQSVLEANKIAKREIKSTEKTTDALPYLIAAGMKKVITIAADILTKSAIQTKNDIMQITKDSMPTYETRRVLAEALNKSKANIMDIAANLKPRQTIKEIASGIDELIVEKHLNNIYASHLNTIPAEIYAETLKALYDKNKQQQLLTLDIILNDYLKGNLKDKTLYNDDLFDDYLKLQQYKSELEKIIAPVEETYMLDELYKDKILDYYIKATEFIKDLLTKPVSPNYETNVEKVMFTLTNKVYNEIGYDGFDGLYTTANLPPDLMTEFNKKIITEKYVKEAIDFVKEAQKLSEPETALLTNTFLQVDKDKIDWDINRDVLVTLDDYRTAVLQEAAKVKEANKDQYKDFKNLFKTAATTALTYLVNNFLIPPSAQAAEIEKPDYKKEIELLVKKSNETLNKKIADNKEKIKNITTADEFLKFLNTSIIPELPIELHPGAVFDYEIELYKKKHEAVAFVYVKNDSNIMLVDNSKHIADSFLKGLLNIAKENKVTKLDIDFLCLLYHEYLHKQCDHISSDEDVTNDTHIKRILEGINDLKAITTVNRFSKLLGVDINIKIDVAKGTFYGYPAYRTFIKNICQLFGVNVFERIDEIHNIINHGYNKLIPNKFANYLKQFTNIDIEDINIILQLINKTEMNFDILIKDKVIQDMLVKYNYKDIKEFIKKDVEKPKIIYNDAGDNLRLIQRFMIDNDLSHYKLNNDSIQISTGIIQISSENYLRAKAIEDSTHAIEIYKSYEIVVYRKDKITLLNQAKSIIDKFELLKSKLKEQKDTTLISSTGIIKPPITEVKSNIDKLLKITIVKAIKQGDLVTIKRLLQEGVNGSEFLKIALELERNDIYNYLLKYIPKYTSKNTSELHSIEISSLPLMKITPLEQPKPMEGFSKGLYKVKAEGEVAHGVRSIEELQELFLSGAQGNISVSTPYNKGTINRNIVVKSKIPETEGLYAHYDADAGKDYGYDELRIGSKTFIDNIDKIYLTQEMYDDLASEEPLEGESFDDTNLRYHFWEDNYELFEVKDTPSEDIFESIPYIEEPVEIDFDEQAKEFQNIFNTKSDIMYNIINKYADKVNSIEELAKIDKYIEEEKLKNNIKEFNEIYNSIDKSIMKTIIDKYIIYDNGKLKINIEAIDNITIPVQPKSEVQLVRENILQEDVPFDSSKYEYFLKNWKGQTTSAQIIKLRLDMVKMGLTKSKVEKALLIVIGSRDYLKNLTPKQVVDNFDNGKDHFGRPINKNLLFSDDNIKLVYKQNQEFLIDNTYDVFRSCQIPRKQYNDILNSVTDKNGEIDYNIFAIESFTDDYKEAMTFRAEITSEKGHICIFDTIPKDRLFATYQASEEAYKLDDINKLSAQNEMLVMSNVEDIKYYEDKLMTELIYKVAPLNNNFKSIAVTSKNNEYSNLVIGYIISKDKAHFELADSGDDKISRSNTLLYVYNLMSLCKSPKDVDRMMVLSSILFDNKSKESFELLFPTIDFKTTHISKLIKDIIKVDAKFLLTPDILIKIFKSNDVNNIDSLLNSGLDRELVSRAINNLFSIDKADVSYAATIYTKLVNENLVKNSTIFRMINNIPTFKSPEEIELAKTIINKSIIHGEPQNVILSMISKINIEQVDKNIKTEILKNYKYKSTKSLDELYMSIFKHLILNNNLADINTLLLYLRPFEIYKYRVNQSNPKELSDALDDMSGGIQDSDMIVANTDVLVNNYTEDFIKDNFNATELARFTANSGNIIFVNLATAFAKVGNYNMTEYFIKEANISHMSASDKNKIMTEIYREGTLENILYFTKMMGIGKDAYYTTIYFAVNTERVDLLEELLKQGYPDYDDNYSANIITQGTIKFTKSIDMLTILKQYNKIIDPQKILNKAISNNNMPVIEFIVNNYPGLNITLASSTIQYGNIDLLKLLIKSGAKIEHDDFYIAIRTGDIEKIKALAPETIRYSDDIDYAFDMIRKNEAEIIRYLLDKYTIPSNIVNNYLDKIMQTRDLSIISECGNKGMKINTQDSFQYLINIENITIQDIEKLTVNMPAGLSAIYFYSPVCYTRLDIIKYVIENKKYTPDTSLLSQNIIHGNIEIVKYLISKKIQSPNVITSLIKNIPDLDLIKTALENDSYKYDIDDVRLAINLQYNDIVKLLIDKKPDILNNPLELIEAAFNSNNTEIYDLLTSEYSFDINPDDDIKAIKEFKNDIFKIIVKNKTKIDKKKLLDVAVTAGNDDAVKILIDSGVTSTPVLNKVIKNKNNILFTYMIEHGFESSEALSYAVEINATNLVKMIIENQGRADVDVLLPAVKNNNLEIAKMIIDNIDKHISRSADAVKEAVKNNNFDMLKLIYQDKTQLTSDTLIDAISHSNFDITKFIIDEAFKTDTATLSNALIEAVIYNNNDIFDYLLQHNAKLPAVTIALERAIMNKNEYLVNKLLDLGAEDLDAAMEAMKYDLDNKIIIKLIDKGMVNESAFTMALHKNNDTILQILLNKNIIPSDILDEEDIYEHPDLVKELINKGFTSNDISENVIKQNNIDLFNFIIDKNIVDLTDTLMNIITTRNQTFFDIIMQKNIDITNSFILTKALKESNAYMTQKLIDKGFHTVNGAKYAFWHDLPDIAIDMINRGMADDSTIYAAVGKNSVKGVELLIDKGLVDKEIFNEKDLYEYPDMVKLLVNKGIKNNVALVQAVNLDNFDLVKFLVDNKVADPSDYSLLARALSSSDNRIAEYLIDNHIFNEEVLTSLINSKNFELFKRVIEKENYFSDKYPEKIKYEACLNIIYNNNGLFLDYVLSKGYYDADLVSHISNVKNNKNMMSIILKYTPVDDKSLLTGIQNGDIKAVKKIIGKGNIADSLKEELVETAIKYNQDDIADYLISKDIFASKDLHTLAKEGKFDLVKKLLHKKNYFKPEYEKEINEYIVQDTFKMLAANAQIDIIKYIINEGYYTQHLFEYYISANNLEVVKLLVKNAPADEENLKLVAQNLKDLALVKILISKGAKSTQLLQDLSTATDVESVKIYKYLLKYMPK